MDITLIKAARIFLRECYFAESARNLRTKIRIVLRDNYSMDMYYNRTLGKSAYTLIKEKRGSSDGIMPHIISISRIFPTISHY